MKIKIIEIADVDFSYIGLAYFMNEEDAKEFFKRLTNKNLNKAIIKYYDSLFEVVLVYEVKVNFNK